MRLKSRHGFRQLLPHDLAHALLVHHAASFGSPAEAEGSGLGMSDGHAALGGHWSDAVWMMFSARRAVMLIPPSIRSTVSPLPVSTFDA